ncbi:hypothetical protein TorRG33x02_114940 [Trema orientale]|uniref:Uncharacterized protein n=1 Tax=Trema orientale TaxID=63057 RepID=A0A2P5F4C6_TREOI|nr:hypothetical protein TorRG33x02_114940 [Trema orientale]
MRRNQIYLGFGPIHDEKKRKAKDLTVERATHMTRRREMKMMVVATDFWEETNEEVESMLKERSCG